MNGTGRVDPVLSSPQLIGRLRDGDTVAFEAVFHEYYRRLCGFAYRLTKSAVVAEDIVQDVFGALWSARRQLHITSSLRAYLFAAVRNRAFNLRKHEAVVAEWENEEADDDVRLLHPPPAQPDELLERAQLEERLAAALESLPPKCSLVMRLRWREQMSYAEIAEAVGISIKGVEKQLERGMKAIRAEMTKGGGA